MKSPKYPLGRKDNIVIQELDDEILIYDLVENKAFCLNQTSAMIWQECDGTKEINGISRAVSEKLRTPVSEDVVWLALSQLKADKLLDESDSFKTPLDGLNRREVIKRVGFAANVALPVISAVIAPSAVSAASAGCSSSAAAGTRARPGGSTCANNNDCCTNSCSLLFAGFGFCTSGSIPAGGAPCCAPVACPSQANTTNSSPSGCPCNDSRACVSNACVGTGVCQ